MSLFTSFLPTKSWRLALLWLLCLPFAPALASSYAAGPVVPTLAQALNPDGTLRPDAQGSFDAQQYAMSTAPDGKPVFRPTGTAGAGDEKWLDGFGLPNGTEGWVMAIVTAGTDVYVAGSFNNVGGIVANNVARWDGSRWHALGQGSTNGVNLYATSLVLAAGGELYVGGHFTEAGGQPAPGVARWNGTNWSAVGNPVGSVAAVRALALAPNGDLYATGMFTQAGGYAGNNIARWDGLTWYPLGAGMSDWAECLLVAPTGDLYVSSYVQQGGSTSVVGRWDGSSWTSLGTFGTTSERTLALSATGTLYLGGSSSQGAAVLARWTGSTWTPVGSSLGAGIIYTLAFAANGDLYAGGDFSMSGSSNRSLARWNGTSWQGLAGNLRGKVSALAQDRNGEWYAGGIFAQVGSVSLNNLGHWNGSAWSRMGSGLGLGIAGAVYAVAVASGGDVYVAGNFVTAGELVVNNVAKWDGTRWTSLGAGTLGEITKLAAGPNGSVYATGSIPLQGGSVAKWDGTAWSALPGGLTASLSYRISDMTVAPSGDLFVVGSFQSAAGVAAANVARWDGTRWYALGAGISGNVSVSAVAVAANGDVYVGGSFTQAGNVAANNVARWDGTSWSPLGSGSANGVNGLVMDLTIASTGEVYACGPFSMAGGLAVSNVARWNGGTWSALGAGLSYAPTTLAVDGGGTLYAGGDFSQSTPQTKRISKWDGSSWAMLGSGLNGHAYYLATGPGNKLYAGGLFSATADGSRAMVHFGIYDPAAQPAAVSQPRKADVPDLQLYPNPAHGPATLTLTLAPAPVARPVQMLDALGRLVRTIQVPAQASSLLLSVAGLPAGTYTVRCGAASTGLVVE